MASDKHPLSKRYPELQHFDTREEAKQVVSAWQKQQMKMPKFWLTLLAYTVGVGVLVVALLISIRRWVYIPGSMYGGLVGGITGGSGLVVITWFWRFRCRKFIRQQLVARGIPICIKCGYDVRGQIEPRCSECGTPFDAKLIDRTDGCGARANTTADSASE